MRDRWAGRVANNRPCYGADRTEYDGARQGSKRGITATMFAGNGLRRNQ